MGSALSVRRDALCRCARALVLRHAVRQRRCRRPHDLLPRSRSCYIGGGGGRTYGRPWIFHVQMLLACGPLTVALALHGSLYYIGMALLNVLFFFALEAHLDQPAEDLRARADRERARGGAGRPVRHRAEQHAARAVHVPRRRRLAVMNHRFSEMMNLSDDLVQRGAERVRHHRTPACVAGSISAASGKMILAEIENIAGPRHDHHRSRRRRATARCPGRSSRWPAAAPSCCSRTSPSGAMRRPGSAIWRATTNSPRLPNRVNFRDEIGRLLAIQQRRRPDVGAAVRRPRPVQAGQRHARPSLRRPVAVRGGRPAARDAAAGGFRGALRRRRIRRVPAEHPFRTRTPPAWRGASSTA